MTIYGSISVEGVQQKGVEFLLDSGSSMSVISTDLCDSVNIVQNAKSVLGVGGSQKVGEPVLCCFELGPYEFADYPLRPIDLPSKCRTVILGRDFMSQWGGGGQPNFCRCRFEISGSYRH